MNQCKTCGSEINPINGSLCYGCYASLGLEIKTAPQLVASLRAHLKGRIDTLSIEKLMELFHDLEERVGCEIHPRA